MPRKVYKPVVAVDVDGVVNAFRMDPDNLLPGWERIIVDVPEADIPDSPFLRRPPEGIDHLEMPLILNPSLHGPWITELRERAEVVWATTWEDMANYVLCPLLGIEPLPVATRVLRQKPRFEQVLKMLSAEWKGMALRGQFSDREVCWIDDQNRRQKGGFDKRRYLGITTDPAIGLTAEEMARVDHWVDNATRWFHGEGAQINA